MCVRYNKYLTEEIIMILHFMIGMEMCTYWRVYPTRKKHTSKIFPLTSPYIAKMLTVIKYFFSDQILLKLTCSVDENLCLPSRRTVNGFWRRLFNDTVYMEFRVCFTTEKHENDMFSLCETCPMRLLICFAIPKSIFISQDGHRLN